MEKHVSKLVLFLIFLFTSCMSTKERALSDALGSFTYQVNDLRLDKFKFNGPVELKKDKRNFYPRKNHILYGWKSIIKRETVWIYVEVDSTFVKEPSASFSDNFFEVINANR